MGTHRIKITQVTRVERSIVIDVEADTLEDALEQEADVPNVDDPRWTVERDSLENEEVTAA